MTKKLFLVVSIILCCVFVLGACTPNATDSEIPDAPVKPSVPKTDISLVSNGTSNYKIVVPVNIDENVSFAANDLQLFVNEASGVTLPIVTDTGSDLDENEYVISVGNTNVFATSGLTLTDDMGLTGFFAKRFGNTIVLNAKDGNGVCSAVYEFLKQAIDLEIYSYDEYDYTSSKDIKIPDIDVKYIPTFDTREILLKSLTSQYKLRMGLYNALGKGKWAAFAHTTITNFLPDDKYYEQHKDWYNSAVTQVCYSNEEMRKEMVEQMKARIIDNPDARFIQMGHEDNEDMCECDACVAERELYGGYSGQELNFTNKIAKDLNAWMADTYPDRTMKYVFFAYQTSQTPPVKMKTENGVQVPVIDENGNFVPYYDGFEVEDNVMVMYCPIDSDFSKSFSETENESQYNQLKGWADLFRQAGVDDGILLWSYSLAVRSYFLPLNNFGMYKTQYEFYADSGVSYVMDQAQYDSGIPCFEALRVYTMSKLMYDNSLDYNELANDFIDHYYGEAADTFRQYYNYFRSYYAYLGETKGFNGSIWYNIDGDATFWPTEVVDVLMGYIDQCLADIEPLKETNYARWTLLNDRLRRERITPIYLMFALHIKEVPSDKKQEYYNDMVHYTKKYEIIQTGESRYDIDTLLEKWESLLFDGGAN